MTHAVNSPRHSFGQFVALESDTNIVFDASVGSYEKSGTWSPSQGQVQLSAHNVVSPLPSIPPKRALPAPIALMMTKSDRQRKPSVLEQYAQGAIPLSASCQSAQKRCLFPDCIKMAVSKGLCRGHGGGRRCHFVGGCTKSAQSRSMFCWAHGGGQRCEVDNCKRSRKTRRYCVAHMHLEKDDYGCSSMSWKDTQACHGRYVPVYKQNYLQSSQQLLPSLGHALYAASLSLPRFPVLSKTRF